MVNHSSLHLTSPLACLGDLTGGTSWDLVPDAFNHAWQILDERPDELQRLALQVVG